jgi:hypothetical protein
MCAACADAWFACPINQGWPFPALLDRDPFVTFDGLLSRKPNLVLVHSVCSDSGCKEAAKKLKVLIL